MRRKQSDLLRDGVARSRSSSPRSPSRRSAPARATWRCCSSRTSASSRRGRSASCCSRTWWPPMSSGRCSARPPTAGRAALCAVVADLVRAVAFVGIVLVDGFVPTVALALLAGVGHRRCSRPPRWRRCRASWPERLPAATSLYGAIGDFGFTAGPALAALVLVVGGPEHGAARERRHLRRLGGGPARRSTSARAPSARPRRTRARRCSREPREGLRAAARDARPPRVLAGLGRGALLRRPVQRGRAAVRQGGARRRASAALACRGRARRARASSPARSPAAPGGAPTRC